MQEQSRVEAISQGAEELQVRDFEKFFISHMFLISRPEANLVILSRH
jgi:hypothetical protein